MKTALLALCLPRPAAARSHRHPKLPTPKSGILLESIWHQGKTRFQLKSPTRHTPLLTPSQQP